MRLRSYKYCFTTAVCYDQCVFGLLRFLKQNITTAVYYDQSVFGLYNEKKKITTAHNIK